MGEGEKKEEKREEKREETPTAKEKEEKKETMFDGSGREIESSSSEKPNNSTEEEEKKETQPKAERESVAKTEGEEEKGAEIATEKKESGSDTDVASKTEESENEEDKATKKEEKKEDAQGNPIDEEGRLVLEEMKSIDELTDEDFTNPTRTVQLPKIPENVDAAIGANGKPVIIKRNIFEKNKNHHKELNAEDGRNIINRALYNPDIVATNQPITRPDYKVVIQTGDKNAAVVLDVYQGKDNVEVVGWRQMEANGLERLKRQVKREGGQLLILSPSDGSAAALSALPSDSQGKATESEGEKQEEKEKKEAKPKAKSKGKKITPKAQTTRKFKEPKDFKDFVGPKDERRFLRSVFYDKEKGKVVATDAHIMIAIDHDMNGEKNAGQVVEARTGWVFLEPKETEQPVLDKNGKKIIDKDGHALMEKKPNPNAGKPIAYPNWEGLIPTDKPTNTIRLTDEARTRLKGLCGTELKDHLDELILIKVGDAYFRPEWLMKAMKGTEFLEGDVRIETRGQTHPMVIRGDNGIMLLMPANIGDSNEYIDGTTGDIKETATDNTISTAAEKLTETTAKLRMAEAALEATHNATFNKKEEVTKAIEAYKKSLEKKVTAWTMANGGEMAADEDVEAKRKEIYKEETKVIDNNNLEFVQLLYDRKSGLKGSDWSDGKIAAKVINEYGNQEEWRYSRGREGREEREGRETEAEHRAKEKAETPREKMRQKMIGRRAQAIGGKLGVKVNTRHSKPGEPGVRAMYDTRTGEVTVLTDNIHGLRELESVMAHEIVAHGGMRALMGRRFDGFCDRVWNAMSAQAKWQMGGYAWDGMTRRQKSAILGEEAQEKKWDDLTGEEKRKALRDTGVQRIAADELMAHRAERKSLKDESLMERIVGWIREMLGRIGLTNMTNEDVDHLLRESRRNLEGKTNTASLAENGLSEGEAKEETEVRYSRVTDKEKIAELENGKKVTVYRAMQMVDGKLYPPMAGKVDGKWQEAAETDVWYQVDERPDLLDKNGKFKLNKGNGSTPTPVAYNPYWHTSRSPLNDQFSSAWKRGELVTVECEVPESELTSGYKAEGAKDAVGEREWKEGPVSRELNKQGKPRRVILSRYVKVKRVLPESEVAQAIADRLKGTGIEIPFNTVTPQLREALEKEGVKIDAPEKNNAGDASRAAYEEWKKEGIRYSRTTDITKIGLRKLQEGETSYVERRY
ncbi:MAG: hypothetical protein II951_10740, partial [Bacteroidales bacterium]|nr:hypothetical protein [Bacteroidales bacterium]